MKQLGETNFDTLAFPPFVKNILSMKQLGESNSGTIQFSNYVTVWGVELVVTHQTSWLESIGVPGASSAIKQPGESNFVHLLLDNFCCLPFGQEHPLQ